MPETILARAAGQWDKNDKMPEKTLSSKNSRTIGQESQDARKKFSKNSRTIGQGSKDARKSLARAAGQWDKNHKMPEESLTG